MAAASIIQIQRAIESHERHAANVIASTFASISSSALVANDLNTLETLAKDFLKGNSHVSFVAFYGENEQQVAYFDRVELLSEPLNDLGISPLT